MEVTSKNDLVSIVTISFNQADFLSECLTSVSKLNDHCYEHIVIDAGSSDGSLTILENFAANHSLGYDFKIRFRV